MTLNNMPEKKRSDKKENIKVLKTGLKKLELSSPKDIAMDFAMKVHQRFDRMVKASILFGSQAKDKASSSSDIDIILIIDDASINWDLELISWYREELAKIIEANDYGKELHVNTVKLTTWWQDMLYGDPVIINILRSGEALIDSGGFFNPLKALLLQGKIHSTLEAVYAALQRAPSHLARSHSSEMGAIEGVYWCMIDAAQAALMTAGKMPPSPEYVPSMLKETFVDSNVLSVDAVKALSELSALHKSIIHGEIRNIKGTEIDKWQETADKFLREMTGIINKLVDAKKD